METAMKAIGAKPLDWGYKTECCGAGLSVSETDIVAKLSGKIVYDAESRGADAIVVACPMCQSNLDMRRPEINEYLQRDSKVPALFITQVIGLAIGLSEKALGIDRLLLPAGNAVKIEAPAKQTVVKEKVEA
jgi:heterodisulfide reductase subunit B